MSVGSMPVAPQVLQDLLLAKRACFELGSAGEVIELWEAYALAQIDAVFVTVEPRGGSKKPSGKPFLYAYLRKAPLNHP